MCSLNSCFTVLVIISIIAIFYMKQKQRIFIDSPLIISQRDAVFFGLKVAVVDPSTQRIIISVAIKCTYIYMFKICPQSQNRCNFT